MWGKEYKTVVLSVGMLNGETGRQDEERQGQKRQVG